MIGISVIINPKKMNIHLEVILPIFILCMSFAFKLCIDKDVSLPATMEALYELPVDTMFLSVSLIAAAIMQTEKYKNSDLMVWFIAGILLTVVSVVIWRKTTKASARGSKIFCGFLLTINSMICIFSIFEAINIL